MTTQPDLGGWQNVRSAVEHVELVQVGDRLIRSEIVDGLRYDIIVPPKAPCLGLVISEDGEMAWYEDKFRVYRRIPVAKQGVDDAGNVVPVAADNPKESIGSKKLPIGLVPQTGIVYEALAFLEGGLTYGAHNYRAIGVKASTYHDAAMRHIFKWWNGEEVDPKTGVPHLASARACLNIILDARVMGKLTDDRPPANPGLVKLMDGACVDEIAHLKELLKDKSPKHWTIADKS